jgi:hypothetical protein
MPCSRPGEATLAPGRSSIGDRRDDGRFRLTYTPRVITPEASEVLIGEAELRLEGI